LRDTLGRRVFLLGFTSYHRYQYYFFKLRQFDDRFKSIRIYRFNSNQWLAANAFMCNTWDVLLNTEQSLLIYYYIIVSAAIKMKNGNRLYCINYIIIPNSVKDKIHVFFFHKSTFSKTLPWWFGIGRKKLRKKNVIKH